MTDLSGAPLFRVEYTYEGTSEGGEQVTQSHKPTGDPFEVAQQVMHALGFAFEKTDGEPYYTEVTGVRIVRVLPDGSGDYGSDKPVGAKSPYGFRFPSVD